MRKYIFFCTPLLGLYALGCCSSRVYDRVQELNAPYQEFLRARPARPLSSLYASLPPRIAQPLGSIATTTFSCFLSCDASGNPKTIYIPSFKKERDALIIRWMGPDAATLEYLEDAGQDVPGASGAMRLVFAGDDYRRLYAEREYLGSQYSKDVYLTPLYSAGCPQTLAIFAKNGVVIDANIINANTMPYFYRNRFSARLYALNYLWSVPVDIVTTPFIYAINNTLWWYANR